VFIVSSVIGIALDFDTTSAASLVVAAMNN
jgi:hypothetical protein